MGNQPSVPKPDTKFVVIGAGLARTGTASFSEAVSILLDGPIYHGGTQTTLGKPVEIKSWIKLLRHWPPTTEDDRKIVSEIIKDRFTGYAGATDAPTSGLVKEMLEVYPDAKVICTTRDPDTWVKSMAGITSASTMWFLRGILLPIPGMRHFVDYIDVLRNQWVFLYGEREPPSRQTYDRHVAWLQEIVPQDRLVFFDVKDGWEPLCKALGKPVPDIPFPRINDAKAIDRLAKQKLKQGLLRWLIIFCTFGLAGFYFINH